MKCLTDFSLSKAREGTITFYLNFFGSYKSNNIFKLSSNFYINWLIQNQDSCEKVLVSFISNFVWSFFYIIRSVWNSNSYNDRKYVNLIHLSQPHTSYLSSFHSARFNLTDHTVSNFYRSSLCQLIPLLYLNFSYNICIKVLGFHFYHPSILNYNKNILFPEFPLN